MFDYQDQPIQEGIDGLRKKDLIKELKNDEYTDSVMAVDGGNIIEKMSGAIFYWLLRLVWRGYAILRKHHRTVGRLKATNIISGKL